MELNSSTKEAIDSTHSENMKHFIKNMRFFISDDKALQIRPKHFAVAARNSNIIYNSSPRGIMAEGMAKQPIVLYNSSPDSIQTKTSYELGKYTLTKRIENSAEVIAVVRRNLDAITGDVSERVLVYRDIETNMIDAIQLPNYNKLHSYFGFPYVIPDYVDTLTAGDILPPKKVLAHTPALHSDGSYGMGNDALVSFLPFHADDEDGCIVSDRWCEKHAFPIYETQILEVDEDEFLLNIHGDVDNYKPLLSIGEKMSTRVLFGVRKSDVRFNPVLLSKKQLCEYNNIFDDIHYSKKPKGIICDIKVYKNRKRNQSLPTGTTEVLDKYFNSTYSYHKHIVNIYNQLNANQKRTKQEELTVGNTFNRLVKESFGIVESAKSDSKLKKMYKLKPVKLYRLEITIEHRVVPGVGFKFSDISANKGTITEVRPWREMAKDKFGNYSDITMDVKSTPSRLNGGRIYEKSIKGSMLKVKRLVTNNYNSYSVDSVDDLNVGMVNNLFDIIHGFIKYLENDLTKLYDKTKDDNNIDVMRVIISLVLSGNFRISREIDQKRSYLLIDELYNSPYRPDKDVVSFIYNGEVKTTIDKCEVAPMYIFLLSKISDTILTTSSANVNGYGLPTAVSKNRRTLAPYVSNPIKSYGEAEKRVIGFFGGRKMLAEVTDINASTKSHSLVYTKILTADKPTDIPNLINRRAHKYGTDVGTSTLNTLNASVGMKLVYATPGSSTEDIVDEVAVDTVNVKNIQNMDVDE